jgi:hypothetical protein
MSSLSSTWLVTLGLGLVVASCAEAESLEDRQRKPDAGSSTGGTGGSGGDTDSGSTGSGGVATGGSAGAGGSTGTGAGGSTGTGGIGGSTGTGGAGGKGGSAAAGGSAGSAGSSATGGSSGAGGSAGTGGTPRPDAGPTGRIFFDDFEDGNSSTPSWIDGDTTLGAMWSVATREAGNRVFAQTAAASDWVIAVSGDFQWTDQVVEANVKRTSAEGMIGIFGRVIDMRNYYFLYLDGDNIILRKKVNGSSANLVKIKFVSASATSYALKLSIVGTTLTGYVDGTMLVTATDAFLASGGIGVGTSDGGTGDFDNVTVSR